MLGRGIITKTYKTINKLFVRPLKSAVKRMTKCLQTCFQIHIGLEMTNFYPYLNIKNVKVTVRLLIH